MNNFKNYSGPVTTEFKSFYSKEKKRINETLKKLGCSNVMMSRQYYYFYGFFTAPSGQVYYFSCSDVRHWPYSQILYRKAKDYLDFSGGNNCYIDKDKLSEIRLK